MVKRLSYGTSSNRYSKYVRTGAKVARKLMEDYLKRKKQETVSKRINALPRYNENIMSTPTRKARFGKKRYFSSVATAKYKGGFRKPKRVKTNKQSLALSKGYHITGEIFGIVADPHCAYITHSTYHLTNFSRVIVGALLRKLFAKAGRPIHDKKASLALINPAESQNTRVKWRLITERIDNSTGAVTTQSLDIPFDATLEWLVANFAMVAELNSYLDSTVTQWEANKLYLYSIVMDNESAEAPMLASMIDIRNETIHLTCSSKLKIQNRTKGDLASGDGQENYDADRVDNQPVYGYRYHFNHGEPRLRTLRGYPTANAGLIPDNFNSIDFYGLRLTRASAITTDQFNEPPNAKLFSNCVKAVKVNLQPGDMKDGTLYWDISGKFTTVIKRLRVKQKNEDNVSGVPGKCEMYGLEEQLRTAGVNPITLGYEKQFQIGCYMTTKPAYALLTTELQTAEINLIA